MKFTTTVFASFLAVASVTSANPISPPTTPNLALNARSGSKLTQAQAASKLSGAGISATSSGNCTDRNNSHCTSYEGVYSGTVDGAITLKGACACTITITGGTEVGHADGTYSHYNGYKFDFAKNSKLDSYVKSAFTRIADRADGYPQWKSNAGNIYCDEGNHWDVTYY